MKEQRKRNIEELESLNEELTTHNHQLQTKVEELELASNELQHILTSLDIATIILDRQLCITRFNPAMSRLMRLMPSHIGRPINLFAEQFIEQGLVNDAQRVLQRLTPIETEVQTVDGRWLIRRTLPYRTDNNTIEGVIVTFIDITERLEISHALNESEESYRLLVDIVHDYAILKFDPQGRITFWNIGAERILGWKRQDILGLPIETIFTPEDRRQGIPAKEMNTAARGEIAADERWHVRHDGSRFWAIGRMIALRDEEGEAHGFCKVMRDLSIEKDLTIEKDLSQELQDLHRTLEQRFNDRTAYAEQLAGNLRTLNAELLLAENRDRRQLAADLHDDLGQLLTLAKMRLAALKQPEQQSRKRKESTAPGEESTSHNGAVAELEQLINQAIRSVRSLTFQLSPPILHELGLVPALQWLGEEMGRQYNLTVLVEADEVPKPIDEDVAFMLFRSVRELLINVVKHAEARRATVEIRRLNDTLVIQVSDNGKGFDTEAVTAGAHGGGYGLFSTRERLSYLGGTMQLQSTAGAGTMVALILPLAATQPEGMQTLT
jgi:two-component system CheB/CheR fusion protein